MANNSRRPIAYPSPQYAAQSPVESWTTVPFPHQGWPPYTQQPPTGSEQFWHGQPNQDYPPGTPPYRGGYVRPPSETSERETVSNLTLLDQSEYGHPLKSPTHSQRSQFYTDSSSDNSTLVHPELYSPGAAVAQVIPVHVHPARADDYLAQAPPSPSPSNPSWVAYIHKLKKLANKVKSFPWMPRERVTVDYYPGTSKHSRREYQHRPLILWRNPDAYSAGYQSEDIESSSDNVSAMPRPVSSGQDLNLLDEFTDGSEPSPQAPLPRRLSVNPPTFENPVPAGYPLQRPQPITWYPGMQQVVLLPQVNPAQSTAPYDQPNISTDSSQPIIPVFPGGYVSADQQQLGYWYGPPVHR